MFFHLVLQSVDNRWGKEEGLLVLLILLFGMFFHPVLQSVGYERDKKE